MANAISAEFVRRIPKTDIHLHLDGSLRLRTLIELAKRNAPGMVLAVLALMFMMLY